MTSNQTFVPPKEKCNFCATVAPSDQTMPDQWGHWIDFCATKFYVRISNDPIFLCDFGVSNASSDQTILPNFAPDQTIL